MSDLRAEREGGERLRNSAGSQAATLQDAYLETRAALSEVRDLYFQRAAAEAAEFHRGKEVEHRMDGLERRMQALETQLVQVITALGQKRNIYQRIVWLLFGKR
jgi:hypothetical protein